MAAVPTPPPAKPIPARRTPKAPHPPQPPLKPLTLLSTPATPAAPTTPATPTIPAAPAPPDPPQERPPVLLLHGFLDNRSVFVLLRHSLRRHGWGQVASLNYSPFTRDLRAAATALGRHVEELCARTGAPRVDVVGHSLGGLMARYHVQRQGGDARVRTLVTLGTPHAGTRVAPLASVHPVVRQMRPDSDVIAELARPAPGCRTRFVSFWSDLDQIMTPVETARIDHPDLVVRNIRVTGVGHLALPVHGTVAAGVRQALLSWGGTDDAHGTASVA
nr:alpha/beta fold hydrolase [Streptomyces caatingaensis]